MSIEVGGALWRLLSVERALSVLQETLRALAARVAAAEQQAAMLWTSQSPQSGGGSSPVPAVVTTAVTARSGSTVGSGQVKLQTAAGTTLSDGATGIAVVTNLVTGLAVGKNCMVMQDSSGTYWLLAGDC